MFVLKWNGSSIKSYEVGKLPKYQLKVKFQVTSSGIRNLHIVISRSWGTRICGIWFLGVEFSNLRKKTFLTQKVPTVRVIPNLQAREITVNIQNSLCEKCELPRILRTSHFLEQGGCNSRSFKVNWRVVWKILKLLKGKRIVMTPLGYLQRFYKFIWARWKNL